MGSSSNDADVLCVRYGHKIRLATTSAYAPSTPSTTTSSSITNANELLGIGYYEKNGRHGILSCVPPLGEKLEHLFNEDEYVVLDPTDTHNIGDVVEYGHTVVLVNQHGMVWNNKTGGITGYVGPRPRGIAGEMYVSFRKPVAIGAAPSATTKDKTASAPAMLQVSLSSASTTSSQSESPPSSSLGFVRFGDTNVVVTVVASNRHSHLFNKRLTNFKKPTSRIAGGYVCCDGKGPELRFTVCPMRPRVSQISMLNKLITSYTFGQKIALPLALLHEKSSKKSKAKPTGKSGVEHAEIAFELTNDATAVLSGHALEHHLQAHAAGSKAATNATNATLWTLPLRNGPGELVLQLVGTAACASNQQQQAPLAVCTSRAKRSTVRSVFYTVVRSLQAVPVPVFALLYALLTHLLWNAVRSLDDSLQRELVVLVLVAVPACYVAVKVDHPFSSLLVDDDDDALTPLTTTGSNNSPMNKLDATAAAATATLKLIVVEYRFALPTTTSPTASSKALPLSPLPSSSPSPLSPTATSNASVESPPATATASTPPDAVATGSNSDALALPNRFLLAEKGDAAKARVRYHETLAWRQEEQLSSILWTPSPNFELIKANYPHYYHKRGFQNEPVYYEKPGKINLKALKAAGLNLDDLMHNYLMVTEFLWQIIEQNDDSKCISVIDVEGIGITDFRGDAVEYVKKAAAVSGKHYPERCAYIFVINIPSWFSTIWSVVKTLIDEVTREKVVMVRGKKNILDALQQRIPLENIPEEYGGTSVGRSKEEELLYDLMTYLNNKERGGDDGEATTTNPIAHLLPAPKDA